MSAAKAKAPVTQAPPRDGRIVVRAEDVATAAGRRELADVVDRLLDDVAGEALRVGAVEVWVTVGRR